jgi:hypothetical protein
MADPNRRADFGTPTLSIATVDSIEARVSLLGAGVTRVRAGQVVRFITDADPVGLDRRIGRSGVDGRP